MSLERIERRFARLRAEGRAGLVPFVMAGDPDAASSAAILAALAEAGADLIEVGMPFSDPMADGPAIQAAGLRALKAGQTMRRTLGLVAGFRARDAETPVILMGYYNPIYAYGVERFLVDAKEAGVDGLIVVDLPAEEDAELCLPARAARLAFVRLVAPTTDDRRLPRLTANATGFIYYVSVTATTGARSASGEDIARGIARIRRATPLPVAVGFGIKTAAQAAEAARAADAVVVGSALVERIAACLDAQGRATPALVDTVRGFAAELAAGVRSGRKEAART